MTRSVLVTGGNRGIGLAIARAFSAAGDAVAITHRGADVPDDLFGVKCDLTDASEVRRAVAEVKEAHGPVEVLISNAGIMDNSLLMIMREEQFQRVLDTNLSGSYRIAKAVVADMMRLRHGRLIFVSSAAGLAGAVGQVNYAASKAGLVGLARSLARELAPRNVTANVIAPGLVETDMVSGVSERHRKEILALTPLARFGRLEEVAGAALWLASSEAGYVTGAVIPVDGGAGMGH